MKSWHLVVVAVLVVAAAAAAFLLVSSEDPSDPFATEKPDVFGLVLPEGTEPSGSVNAFGWDFMDNAGDGNMIFSPYGLYVALGMLANGAEPGSDTEAEILKILRSTDIDSLNAYLDMILGCAGDFGDTRFDSSSMVLVDSSVLSDGRDLDEDFVKAVTRYCDAIVSEADFSGNLDKVKGMISEWVRLKTDGMIPDYQSVATEDTICDLLNVVCFKGKWSRDFEVYNTYEETFHNSDGTTVSVPMMHGDFSGIRYYSDEKFKGLELLYDSSCNGGIGMSIVIPSDPSVLNSLDAWGSESVEYRDAFLQRLHSAEVSDVEVALPKFDISSSYDLKTILEKMGLEMSFNSCAEYSDIVEGETLKVDSGKHQAVIIVDEEGTEASAVTELNMNSMSAGPGEEPKIVFRCDIPFIFTINNGLSRTCLFTGYLGTFDV